MRLCSSIAIFDVATSTNMRPVFFRGVRFQLHAHPILLQKNNILKNAFLLAMFLFGALSSYAQIISYPTAAQNITKGLDSTSLVVRVDFPDASTNVKVQLALGAINNPGSIEYIPNSVSATAGGLTISEFDISNLRSPIFSIGSVNIGAYIQFTIKRRAGCGNVGSTKDDVFVTGTNFAVSETSISTNNYQLLSPALTLLAPAFTNNVNLGVPFNRNFTVTNGGNGCLDSLYVWLKYPTGALQFNSLSVGASILTPSYIGADSILFIVTGSNLSPNDHKLCNGETVVFTENVTALQCGGITSYGSAWSAYDASYCERDDAQTNFSTSNNTPNITSSIINVNYDICFRGEKIKQTIRLTNSGTGAATAVEVIFNTSIVGYGEGRVFFDTSEVWEVRNQSGTLVGTVSNFYQTTFTGYLNASCNWITNKLYRVVRGKLLNVIIPPGGYVDIEVNMETQNMACLQTSCNWAETWATLETSVAYKNQCGTSNYQESPKIHMGRFWKILELSFAAPTDVVPGVFTIDGEFSHLRTMNHPNGSGQSYMCFVLPSNVTVASPTVLIDGITYNTSMVSPFTGNVTDSLWVGNLEQNVNKGAKNFKINFNIVCGTPGNTVIQYFSYNKYSPCAPGLKSFCKTISLNLKCNVPCPRGGATPTKFTLNRVSYGKPDNDNNYLPDASGVINKNLINTHRSVNGDTLLARWEVIVHPNVDPADPEYLKNFRFVNIDFKNTCNANTVGAPGTLSAIGALTAKIYENKDPLSIPIICSVTPTIIGNYYHYELGPSCRGGRFNTDDSIVIEAFYYVNQHNSYNNISNGIYNDVQGFELFVTDNRVYSTYSPAIVVPNLPGTSTAYTCDRFNDYNEMLRIWINDYIEANQTLTGCGTTKLASYMRQYLRNLENGGNIFPYEYRTFINFDTMRVMIPPGFKYKPNTALVMWATATSPWQSALPNADVFQTPGYIYFKNIYKHFTEWGGTLIQNDEQLQLRIEFELEPSCAAVSGTYPSQSSTTAVGNGRNSPLNTTWKVNRGGGSFGHNNPSGWYVKVPNPILTGSNVSQSSDGIATWTVSLQNLSNDASAPLTYLYLTPVNNISNIVVKEGAITITPNSNGFYLLGNLAASGSRELTITGRATICTDDSLLVNLGWNCSAYPTSIAAADCGKNFWLKVTNSLSQIQLTTLRQPQFPNLSLCVVDTVEFRMNSAQAAFADNAVFRVTPPAGLYIVKGQIEFPSGSGNWQDITPTNSGGILEYAIEDHPQIQALYGTKGLPGTFSFPGISNRSANLRIIYNTVCGFSNGSRISVQQRAYKPCGSPIPTGLGFNTIVRTNPIYISSNILPGTVSITSTSSSATMNCVASVTVTSNFIPITINSQVGDSILVTLPYGLQFVPGSFTSAAGLTLDPASPVVGPNGSQYLKIVVPSGLNVGVAANFSYGVLSTNGPNTCGSFPINTEYTRIVPSLECLGTVCTNATRQILDQAETTISVSKPIIAVANMEVLSGFFRVGETHVNRVSLANLSNEYATAPIYIELFCGFSNTSFGTLTFTNDIPANSTVSQTFSISIPAAPTCMSGSYLKGVVRPNTALPQCLCDSSGFIVTSRVLPLKLISFNGLAHQNNVQLSWTAVNDIAGSSFNVAYSLDGTNFISATNIAANGSARYAYQHANTANIIFYRITMVDADGKITYSNILRVNKDNDKEIFIFPNPANSAITISIPKVFINKKQRISILSVDGKELYVIPSGGFGSSVTITINHLPAGSYFVKLSTDDTSSMKKFTVIK